MGHLRISVWVRLIRCVCMMKLRCVMTLSLRNITHYINIFTDICSLSVGSVSPSEVFLRKLFADITSRSGPYFPFFVSFLLPDCLRWFWYLLTILLYQKIALRFTGMLLLWSQLCWGYSLCSTSSISVR